MAIVKQWLTLSDLCATVKVIHFGTNRFSIYDFL